MEEWGRAQRRGAVTVPEEVGRAFQKGLALVTLSAASRSPPHPPP